MSWQQQIKSLAVAVAVLSGIFMALNIGIGEAVQVVVNPNDAANPLDANTTAVFGGNVDLVDRIAVLGVFTTILGTAGLGLLRRSADSPPFINTLITYMPLIVGLVAFTAFGTEVFDVIQGDRDWSLYDDATNSYILFLASSMVAGLMQLLKK
ncbi:MAG: hypothetical protein VW907_01945 [Opitutae bacterium]